MKVQTQIKPPKAKMHEIMAISFNFPILGTLQRVAKISKQNFWQAKIPESGILPPLNDESRFTTVN